MNTISSTEAPKTPKVSTPRIPRTKASKSSCPKRRKFSLQTKKQYIDLMEPAFKKDPNFSLRKFADDLNLHHQTLYTIWKGRASTLKKLAENPESISTTVSKRRDALLEKMELRLVRWYRTQAVENPATVITYQELYPMAIKLLADLHETEPTPRPEILKFQASVGWFKNFQVRYNLTEIPMSHSHAAKMGKS